MSNSPTYAERAEHLIPLLAAGGSAAELAACELLSLALPLVGREIRSCRFDWEEVALLVSEQFERAARRGIRAGSLGEVVALLRVITRRVQIRLRRHEAASRRARQGWWDRRGRGRVVKVGCEGYEEPEQSVAAWEWFLGLSPRDQEVLWHRYVGELSFAGIAFALGISEASVKHRLHCAREAVRCIIEGRPIQRVQPRLVAPSIPPEAENRPVWIQAGWLAFGGKITRVLPSTPARIYLGAFERAGWAEIHDPVFTAGKRKAARMALRSAGERVGVSFVMLSSGHVGWEPAGG